MINHALSGKLLETIGAFLIAYVGLRAAYIELFIVAPIRRGTGLGNVAGLAGRLDELTEARRREFGPYEAMMVAFGTVCVAVGCAWYVVALLFGTGH